jgi:hypothetical protein
MLDEALTATRRWETTLPGISILFDLAQRCNHLLGPWWLGVVDDGVAAETTLKDALRTRARIPARLRWEAADSTDFNASEYFLG